MLNFYPGPSKLYPQVQKYANEAFESGILERNHRSQVFMNMMSEGVNAFKTKFNIPQDYKVYFTSSATECWEITSQSLFKDQIQFIYNGAFGKKWFKYAVCNPQVNHTTKHQQPKIRGSRYFLEQNILEVETSNEIDTFCWVTGETSNGTTVLPAQISELRLKHPNAILITDVTSTLGAVDFDFTKADVWFASVQKCLGLPAGLAVMMVSPHALARAKELNELNHYNSLLNIEANFAKNQTHYTPNILGIYLFSKLMQDIENQSIISKIISKRAYKLYNFLGQLTDFELLVKNKETQSPTVIAIKSSLQVEQIINTFANKGIILGNGYGEWKANTFRIANFPAIPDEHYDLLMQEFENIK